jgi:REase_AHJR-like protein
MSAQANLIASEGEAIRQYAEWYTEQGYQVSVEPTPSELPEFLRTLAPDMIARRGAESVIVEIKTSSPASFEKVQQLARVLEHRAGWKLQVVYIDLADPEWTPPAKLPELDGLAVRLDSLGVIDNDDDQSRVRFLLLWSIIEASARHKLASKGVSPTRRISSSALIKMLLSEGIIEEEQYARLRQGLAVRNAVAHGFLNQPIDAALFDELRRLAKGLLGNR